MIGLGVASNQVVAGQLMVRTGQHDVERLGFRPVGPPVGLEVVPWSEMVARGGPPRWPHRADFHTLLLLDQGRLPFQLDFVPADRGPRSLLWARPGEVQQYGRPQDVCGQLLLFVPEFPAPSEALVGLLGGPRPPSSWTLDEAQHARISETFDDLRRAVARADDALQLQFAQHALSALLLALGAASGQAGHASRHQESFARLHEEIEASYATTRRAQDYADRLGYSLKTLTRAAQATTGLTVKELVDRRVILEAKRSLAHTDASAETIAHRLGFTQATGFAKFFTRHTGETAGGFRRRIRGA